MPLYKYAAITCYYEISALIAGERLSNNRSKQNRISDAISIYLSVWESTVLDISKWKGGCVELPRWTSYLIRGSLAVASWLQYKQHLYYKFSGSYNFLLQSEFWRFINWRYHSYLVRNLTCPTTKQYLSNLYVSVSEAWADITVCLSVLSHNVCFHMSCWMTYG